jgi:class 3 adenylate cyclase
MALEMRAAIQAFARETNEPIDVRIGIALGPVVAGVIGKRRFAYDLWGDTVNVAARMESHGVPGEIHVTSPVRDALSDRFAFDARGPTLIKGKGEMLTYWLRAAK